MSAQTIFGEPSYRIRSDGVEAWVTRAGGQVAPVTFRLEGREIQPFHIAPWHGEPGIQPPCIRALRGDFFCLPFGGNEEPYQGERHPVHGETANEDWRLVRQQESQIEMSLDLAIRAGSVHKLLMLNSGHTALYSRHTVSGMSGPTPYGHHAMLRFPSQGLVSTSPFGFGQVFPGQFENPALGGYSSLRPAARFDRIEYVPASDGSIADLSRYPAREGFEDLVMIYSDQTADFAWTAVAFPEEGYLWYCLKDPRILSGTVLWHSNGGRHYAPWNGRHRGVLGLEEVTANFHWGLAGSVGPSDARREGYKTFHDFDPSHPLTVNTIMGVVAINPEVDHIHSIIPSDGGIQIESRNSWTTLAHVDTEWLYG